MRWTSVAAAAIGGAAGTLLIRQAMKLGSRLPENMRPPAPREDPSEFMVRQAERAIGTPLPPTVRGVATRSLPFAYGITWPVALALLAPRLRSVKAGAVAGSILGAAVWAIGYLGWLPATGLAPAPGEQRIAQHATGMLGHAAYGLLTVVPIVAGERWLARRRPTLARVLRAA